MRPNIGEPFIGTEALACGFLDRHQLRTRYRLVFPNVYLSKDTQLSLDRRTAAAWLWASGEATIGGLAAAALHGAKWIDDDVTIELIEETYYAPASGGPHAGWEDVMVAVEYDGEQHRNDLLQYRKDIRRLEWLERMGWIVIRVVAGDHPAEILRRVRCALDARKSSVN